jgi:hypothetical protein
LGRDPGGSFFIPFFNEAVIFIRELFLATFFVPFLGVINFCPYILDIYHGFGLLPGGSPCGFRAGPKNLHSGLSEVSA